MVKLFIDEGLKKLTKVSSLSKPETARAPTMALPTKKNIDQRIPVRNLIRVIKGTSSKFNSNGNRLIMMGVYEEGPCESRGF